MKLHLSTISLCSSLRVLGAVFLFAGLSGVAEANWDAAPIDVHEWGVNTFDWDVDERLLQELPGYLYTDQRPGEMLAPPEKRVRDLPADGGVRTKPLLYFYLGKNRGRGESEARVGIEMRFAEGYANAWWPQVTRYRTEEESLKGKAPDWVGWKAKALEECEKRHLKNNEDGKAEERWKAELARYVRLDPKDQIPWLARQHRWIQPIDFPEDGRMQLVWEELTLHSELPDHQVLAGEDLAEDHWAKVAREVDAAFVSNGKEAEHYVFYEGKTREEPAIGLLPANGGAGRHLFGRKPDKRKEVLLVNVGEHPIHDVVAIYRDRAKGILWTGHIALLEPRAGALRIPDFSNPREDDELKASPEGFRRQTSERLIENLTSGTPIVLGNVMMRDPADPQGPTDLHQLYKKEALGLEKIWHDDFFEAEGLTVLYRESPAYLDEAMPLNIFTSMFWYIRLSRCGLVLNRNLPLGEVHKTDEALWRFQMAHWNEHLKDDLKEVGPQLKKHRLLTLGQARFRMEGRLYGNESMMRKVRDLVE